MNSNPPNTLVYGIVPAAGAGRRMGLPKQVLPFREGTMAGSVVRMLLDSGLDRAVIVTRSELVARLGLPSDKKLSVIVNDNTSSQMIDSICLGLSALLDDRCASRTDGIETSGSLDRAEIDTGILVVPGDMPGPAVRTCQRCVEAYRQSPTGIVVAAHNGRRGHPLIFPATFQNLVRQLDGALNTLLDQHPELVRFVETDDTAALDDVDTWDQYRSLSAMARGTDMPPAG